MNKTYGCAPVYFMGATVFFIGGGVLIHYDHPVIGTILLVPGLLLLGLTLFAWVMLSRIKSGDVDVVLGRRDQEGTQHAGQPKRIHGAHNQRTRRKPPKRPSRGRGNNQT